jgi:hypothetical protein
VRRLGERGQFIKLVGRYMMIPNARRCVIGLTVVFVLTWVGTATAAAEGPLWLVNGVELKAGEKVKAVGGGTLFFEVAEFGLTIECTKLTEKMTLIGGKPGTDEDVLVYTGCKVKAPNGCKASETITLESNTKLKFLIKVGGKWKRATEAEWEAKPAAERGFGDEFVGKTGGVIGTFTLTGAECLREGRYSLTGSYVGLVNNGLEFISELDELKLGTAKAVATGRLEYEGEAGQKLAVGQ